MENSNQNYLKQQAEALQAQLTAINKELKAIEFTEEAKKYKCWVGKCYKRFNAENPGNYPHYFYVWGIDQVSSLPLVMEIAFDNIETNYFICQSDESFRPGARILFEGDKEIEISKSEFDKAFAEVQKRIDQIK